MGLSSLLMCFLSVFSRHQQKNRFWSDVGCAGCCARCEGSRCDSTATKHHTRDRHHLVRGHYPYHIHTRVESQGKGARDTPVVDTGNRLPQFLEAISHTELPPLRIDPVSSTPTVCNLAVSFRISALFLG